MTERSELEVRLDELCAGHVRMESDHKHLDECVDRLRLEVHGLRQDLKEKHARLMQFVIGSLVSALVAAVAAVAAAIGVA